MSGTEPTPTLVVQPESPMPEAVPPDGATDESMMPPPLPEPVILERNDPTILRNPLGMPLRGVDGKVLREGDEVPVQQHPPLDPDLEAITREGDMLGLVTRFEFNSLVQLFQELRNAVIPPAPPPEEPPVEEEQPTTLFDEHTEQP